MRICDREVWFKGGSGLGSRVLEDLEGLEDLDQSCVSTSKPMITRGLPKRFARIAGIGVGIGSPGASGMGVMAAALGMSLGAFSGSGDGKRKRRFRGAVIADHCHEFG